MAVLLFAPIVAKATITAAGVLVLPRGIDSVSHADGTGLYVIALTDAIPLADFLPPLLSLQGAVAGTITFFRIDDVTINVITWVEVAGSLVVGDREFGFVLMRNEG